MVSCSPNLDQKRADSWQARLSKNYQSVRPRRDIGADFVPSCSCHQIVQVVQPFPAWSVGINLDRLKLQILYIYRIYRRYRTYRIYRIYRPTHATPWGPWGCPVPNVAARVHESGLHGPNSSSIPRKSLKHCRCSAGLLDVSLLDSTRPILAHCRPRARYTYHHISTSMKHMPIPIPASGSTAYNSVGQLRCFMPQESAME